MSFFILNICCARFLLTVCDVWAKIYKKYFRISCEVFINGTKSMVSDGASKGIGLQIVLAALKEGNIVVGTSRDAQKLSQAVATELGKTSKNFWAVEMAFDETSIDTTGAQVIAKYGRIDVLVNNAGYALLGAVEEVELSAVKKILMLISLAYSV